MTNFRTAIALSLVVHLIFFFFMRPFPLLNKGQFDKRDYHLPVEVELFQPAPVRANELKTVQPPTKQALLSEYELPSEDVFPDASKTQKAFQSIKIPQLLQRKQQPKGVAAEAQAETSLQSNKAWNRAPIYPDRARQLGQEGRVLLDVQLSDSGKVISVQVARSTGFEELDEAAIEAVKTWTMDAPKSSDRRIFIPVTFKLDSKPSN